MSIKSTRDPKSILMAGLEIIEQEHENLGARSYRLMKPRDIELEIQMYIGERKTVNQILAVINSGKTEEESIGATQVYKDISAAVKLWKERMIDNLPIVVAREMGRLERLEDEYWGAWARSLIPEEDEEEINFDGIRIPLGGDQRNGQPNTAQSVKKKKKRTRSGNPMFLQGIERVIDLRFRLLGVGKTSTLNVNWRKEAEASGVNPDEVIDLIVSKIVDDNDRDRVDKSVFKEDDMLPQTFL